MIEYIVFTVFSSGKKKVVEVLSSCSILNSDGERSLVLDAMALLGGSEYFIQQMTDRLCETNYR